MPLSDKEIEHRVRRRAAVKRIREFEQYQNVQTGRTREQIGEAHQPRQKPFGQWRPRRAGEEFECGISSVKSAR